MKKRKININGKTQSTSSAFTKTDANDDVSLSSQRQRLLNWLRENGRITTLEARGLLNILSPAARIYELRQEQHNIVRYWVYDFTSEGRKHRVAKYVLLSGKYNKEEKGGKQKDAFYS